MIIVWNRRDFMDLKEKVLSIIGEKYCTKKSFFRFTSVSPFFEFPVERKDINNYTGTEKIAVMEQEKKTHEKVVRDLEEIESIDSVPTDILLKRKSICQDAVMQLLRFKKQAKMKISFKEKYILHTFKNLKWYFLIYMFFLTASSFYIPIHFNFLDTFDNQGISFLFAIFSLSFIEVFGFLLFIKIANYFDFIEDEKTVLAILQKHGISEDDILHAPLEFFKQKRNDLSSEIESELLYYAHICRELEQANTLLRV